MLAVERRATEALLDFTSEGSPVSELTTAHALLFGVLLVIATISALTWRESRWERRAYARQRDRTRSGDASRESR